MNSLQKDFIERTIAALEALTARAAESAILSQEFLREISRVLHTIKGTSQTFGFSASSNIAHELENFLAAVREDADLKAKLLDGFAILIESFEQVESSGTKVVVREGRPINDHLHQRFRLTSKQIPAEISAQLSGHEKDVWACALLNEKEIFCLNATFETKNFDVEFKKLREDISSNGEIIATLPDLRTKNNKIGFLIYFAADHSTNLSKISQNSVAEIDCRRVILAPDLGIVFSEIESHAESLARAAGKEIKVAIAADDIKLSRKRSNLIFDILLHLIRNAVDHAIETPEERIAKDKSATGKIEIVLKSAETGFVLSVKDDGSGIDMKKLRAKAIEKNLVRRENDLTENELLDLIFLHDFSTAEAVTEISGRGVGLDAVKAMVENVGGTIGVKSMKDSGTTFEIFLPEEN
jgi:two-component system chemotaxis sensor kinase CheA